MKFADKAKVFYKDHDVEIWTGVCVAIAVGITAGCVYLQGYCKGFDAGMAEADKVVKMFEPEAHARLVKVAKNLAKVGC